MWCKWRGLVKREWERREIRVGGDQSTGVVATTESVSCSYARHWVGSNELNTQAECVCGGGGVLLFSSSVSLSLSRSFLGLFILFNIIIIFFLLIKLPSTYSTETRERVQATWEIICCFNNTYWENNRWKTLCNFFLEYKRLNRCILVQVQILTEIFVLLDKWSFRTNNIVSENQLIIIINYRGEKKGKFSSEDFLTNQHCHLLYVFSPEREVIRISSN